MASMSVTPSLFPSSSSALTTVPSRQAHRGAIVAKATGVDQGEKGSMEMKQESSSGRRDLLFAAAAAAAAAVCSFANVAMGEEPKGGTPEAKKKYAPICVTMPTAKVCHK
ncbi:hypothetical protein V6N13_095515 [Hibiscus sabdariffa]|uniref:Photosystem II 5 kDa protein, chloroplastic n=1 Tax=Hibiscus sabdariffa TaxID=183260 RepID=A0ABR2PRR3_9ROSI